MASSRRLELVFTGDTSALDRAFRKVDRSADSMARSVGRSSKQIAKYAAIGGAALGTAFAVGALKAADAASDLDEAMNKNRAVFEENAKAVDKWATDASRNFGLTKTAALDGAASIGAMLKPMGLSAKQASVMSVRMSELAGDMASFNNQDPTEMLDRIRAGLSGESEPLKQFGSNLSEARVKLEAVRIGLVEEGEQLTEVQKIRARYSLLLKDTSDQHGDFQKTSGGMANATRILKAEWGNLTADIGRAVVPTMLQLIYTANNVVATIRKHWPQIQPVLYKVFQAFDDTMNGAREAVGVAVAFIRRHWDTIKDVTTQAWAVVLKAVRDTMEWMDANVVPTVRFIVGYLRGFWKRHGDDVRKVFNDVVKVIASALKAVKATIQTVLAVIRGDWSEAWDSFKEVVTNVADGLATAFKGGVRLLVIAVKEAASRIWEAAKDVGKAIAKGIWSGFESALMAIPGSGALRRVLGMSSGDIDPARVQSVIGRGGGFGAVTGRTMGGFTPGPYRGRDYMLTALDGDEAVLNPTQISMVPGGRATITNIFRRTGGRMGGGAFATGGYVTGGVGGNWGGTAPIAMGLARLTGLPITSQKRGTKYTASGGVSDHWTGSTSSYAVDLGATGAAGDTAANLLSNKIGAGSYPGGYWLNRTVSGFRFQLGWKTPGHFDHVHLGIKNTGGGNASGLEDLLGGGASGGSSGGAGSSAPAGISVKQFTSALAQAKSTGAAGQASRPSLTDVPSVDRRHADDALQERVIRRRGGKDSDVYAFQKKELERDIKDVTKQIRKLVAQRNRLVKLQRTLRRQGASTKTSRVTREALLERFRNVSQTLTETRDAIITLQEMRRGMILDAKVLGFDVQDAQAEEAQEAADQAAEETTDPGLTDAQQSALVNLGAWAQSGEAFARAAGGAGDIGAGGRSALAAAFNPGGQAININVQAMHPGDPSVYRAISETVIRALGTQGNVPATTLATGA